MAREAHPGRARTAAADPLVVTSLTGSPTIVVTGLMGSGKTTIGAELAEALGLPFVDNDDLLSDASGGLDAGELADRLGTEALHALEAQVLLAALGSERPRVIAAAASVIERDDVLDALDTRAVVFLDAPVEVLADRVDAGRDHRPLERGRVISTLREQCERRRGRYLQIADAVVDARPDPRAVTRSAIESLETHIIDNGGH